ncbi:MAG: hypothetical protein ACTSPB_01520 [Candidatus Thorarchaeota archaeon]
MKRRTPVQHTVKTKHPRYKVPKYIRGLGTRSIQTWRVYKSYPNTPVEYFGYTRDPNQALWITIDGRLISGSKNNKNPWSDYQHADIVNAYGYPSSDVEARIWQKSTGAIRMRRSSMSPDATLNIELYQRPTPAQIRAISKAVGREGTIYVDYWDESGNPKISRRVRNAGELKRMLDYA